MLDGAHYLSDQPGKMSRLPGFEVGETADGRRLVTTNCPTISLNADDDSLAGFVKFLVGALKVSGRERGELTHEAMQQTLNHSLFYYASLAERVNALSAEHPRLAALLDRFCSFQRALLLQYQRDRISRLDSG